MRQNILTMERLAKEIGMTKEMEACAASVPLSGEEYGEYRRLFDSDPEAFFARVKEQKNYRAYFLRLYLQMACQVYGDYREKGIPERVFFDTFKDIPLWAENCLKAHGEMGIEEYSWLSNHLRGRLFRLGRLQYETVMGDERPHLYGRAIWPGETALNIHIPGGEPLCYESCVESLREAAAFFQNPRVAVCFSWLLSPALKEILPESSNILKFQSLFHIYALDRETREAEERVFGPLCGDPARYPEDTSLRRAMKEYLLSGKNPGSAYGQVKEEYLKAPD